MADPAGLRLALLALRRGFIGQEALSQAIRLQEDSAEWVGLIDILRRQGHLNDDQWKVISRLEADPGTLAAVDTTLTDGAPGTASSSSAAAPAPVPDAAAPTIERVDAPKTRLGEYSLLRVLGSGGMGVVYEALHEPLNRRVALKVLSPALSQQPHARERFYREVKAAARLNHPNIVPVYDVGDDHGTHYFAMEYIEGSTLDQVMLDKSLSFETMAGCVQTAAEALHYAHSQGIIHRDVKPSNIIRTREGRILLMDFGVAKEVSEAGMTASGALLGTPAYMSPEQAAGGKEPVSPRSDVYSLGATLYELTTGRRPFVGESFEATLAKVLFQDPDRPRLHCPELPLDLETIILKAMAKESERRYASAEELALDLARFRRGEPILARPMTSVVRVMRRLRRHRLTIAVAAVAFLVLVGGGGFLWSIIEDQRVRAAILLEEQEQAARINAAKEAARQRREQSRDLTRSAVLLKGHTPGDARVSFDRAVEADPTNQEAWLERGRFRREQGEFREAVQDLTRAVTLAPDLIDAYAERMVANLCTSDFLRVAGDLDQILKRWPEHRFAKLGRACLLYLNDNKKDAAEAFGLVIAEQPEEALAYAGRGGCLLELGRHQEALNDLNKSVQLEPRNVMALNNRAQLWLEVGQIDRAVADASLSIEYFPSFFWPWEIRGKSRYQTGEYAAAESDLEQALKLGPTQGDSCTFLGMAYYMQRKYHAAVKAMTHALKLKGNRAWGLFYRGLARSALGELAAAGEDAVELRKIQGAEPYALGVEAEVALRQQQPEAAERLAGEGIRQAPKIIELLVTRARAYAAMNKYEEALLDYRAACVADSRQTNLLLEEIDQVKKRKSGE